MGRFGAASGSHLQNANGCWRKRGKPRRRSSPRFAIQPRCTMRLFYGSLSSTARSRQLNRLSSTRRMLRLLDVTRRALVCAPADPFVWLTLFWLEAGKSGLSSDNARYLRLSYALGPNEGWISLWRAKIAFALFEQLPADLADDALDEFVKLIDTQRLYSETATIFANATPVVQKRIIDHLKNGAAIPRGIFARTLYDMGLDVKIPDTVIPGLRSWER